MKDRFNIVYVLHSTDAAEGSTKSFLTLVRSMLEDAHNIYVVLPNKGGIYAELVSMGIHTVVVPLRPATFPLINNKLSYFLFLPMLLSWFIHNAFSLYMLKSFFKNKHIHLIHTNVSIIGIGYQLARTLHIPHIYHIREYGDTDFGYHHFPSKQAWLKKLSAPISYNICITSDIQKYLGLQNSPSSVVIYNGIVSTPSYTVPQRPTHDYFLYAGRIESTKGLLDLILAYAQYAHHTPNPIPLKVAGKTTSPEYRERIDKICKEQSITNNINYLGEVSDISPLLQSARAIIIPSFHEGFGRCMPEAMSNGCLVVARNTGGSKEQLDNGLIETGSPIALSFLSVEELTTHLTTISQLPPEHFNDMKQSAFKVVNQLYSIQSYTQKVKDFYHHILTTHQQSS